MKNIEKKNIKNSKNGEKSAKNVKNLNLNNKKEKAKMEEKKSKKPNIGMYLKRYKWGVFSYIFFIVLGGVCNIFNTILLANGIQEIAIGNFHRVYIILMIAIGVIFVHRGSYYLAYLSYQKTASKIMAEMNLDLAKQAFKLNSKTFNDHDTGTFVQRIVSDPERVVDNLVDIIDVVTDLIMAASMIIYIMTLNLWISLILIVVIAIGIVMELYRVKFRRKNRRNVHKKNDKIGSLTTEIVRSEKDIKSLGLEQKLSEVSKQNYEDYRKVRYKFEIVDYSFWAVRNMFAEIMGVVVMVVGVWLMDLGTITLASFMIIYSNNRTSSFIWAIGNIANTIVDIKVAHERMFSLFDEEEFVTEKFGKKSLENVVGEVEFKDVSFTFREYEYPDPTAKKEEEPDFGGGDFCFAKK